jgi:hypothetical protein
MRLALFGHDLHASRVHVERSTALPPFEIVNLVAKQREGDSTAVLLRQE